MTFAYFTGTIILTLIMLNERQNANVFNLKKKKKDDVRRARMRELEKAASVQDSSNKNAMI